MKYWEIIADKLSKAGWSWGWVSAVDSNGRTIWSADAHRADGKRFIVHADEKLTAFLELESATRARQRFGNLTIFVSSSRSASHLAIHCSSASRIRPSTLRPLRSADSRSLLIIV
jgi:beta-xylosidase